MYIFLLMVPLPNHLLYKYDITVHTAAYMNKTGM